MHVYSDNIEKFGLIVIESLPEKELHTGYELYSSTLKYKLFQEPNLTAEYFSIEGKLELFSLLDILYHRAIDEKFYFILHFEVHGNDRGIVLLDGSLATWEEMLPFFRKINVLFKNLLTIHFAVCKAGWLLGVVEPEKRAPFRTIVASMRNVSVGSLQNGFEAFYDNFFFSLGVEEAVESFNAAISNKEDAMFVITSEEIFDKIADLDRDPSNKVKAIQEVEDDIRKKRYFRNLPQDILRNLALKKLELMFEELKKKRGYFLMEDLSVSIGHTNE